MKTFGWSFLFVVMAFAVGASDGSAQCFNIATNGPNITHIFVDSGCEAGPSEYAITIDGEPAVEFHADDGPCESIPRDVWFPLHRHQGEARVCVSLQGDCSESIQVYAKVGDECITATQPNVSIKRVE